MSRIAIVGVESSGKTVLMAALADLYGEPSHDNVYLMPESQSAFAFMKHIPQKMRDDHQWPAATTIESFKHLKWSVRIGRRVITELEMLDYPGEIYRIAFGERSEEDVAPHRERVHEFLKHLVEADALVVLFNLKDALDLGKSARNTETVWLTRGIFEYAKKLPNIKHHLLLFTQADRYAEKLGGQDGASAAMSVHLPMMQMLFPDLECAAVSVATDDTETPSKDFSSTYGIAGFMGRLIRFSPEGNKASETLLEIERQIDKGAALSAKQFDLLLEELDSLDAPLCELMLPDKLGFLKTQLYACLQQKCISECKTLQSRCQDLVGFQDLHVLLADYATIFKALESRKPENLSSPESDDIETQRQFYERLTELECAIGLHTKTHSLEALKAEKTWLPLYQSFSEKPFHELIKHFEDLYLVVPKKSQVKAHDSQVSCSAKTPVFHQGVRLSRSDPCSQGSYSAKTPLFSKGQLVSGVGFLVVSAAIILGVVYENNKQAAHNRARLEQRAAEEAQAREDQQAQEERIAAEKLARREQEEAAKRARADLERRAAANDPAAQWALGNILATTYSSSSDARVANQLAARNWWRMAGESGHLEAQLKMGGVTSGDEQIRWYTLAAEQHSHVAASRLGQIYENSDYFFNPNNAFKWYSFSSLHGGGAEAQFNAGRMLHHLSRHGSFQQRPQYLAQAVDWHRKAARQNHAGAQKWLDKYGYTW